MTTTSKLLTGFISVIIVFHILVIVGLVPMDIVWGGRIESVNQLYLFETLSIGINVLLGWLILMYARSVKAIIPTRIIRILLWMFAILFMVNTLGNIFAKTNVEQAFAVLTAGMAWLLISFLKEK